MLMATQDLIRRACERAARYRRDIALESGEHPTNLEKKIASDPLPELKASGVPHWFRVGTVVDAVVGKQLLVQWNPETDEVMVDQPDEPSSVPDEPEIIESPVSWSVLAQKYDLASGYRYFFGGKEYTASSAKRMINRKRSLDGWTWAKA
jgi:hypothetical protein